MSIKFKSLSLILGGLILMGLVISVVISEQSKRMFVKSSYSSLTNAKENKKNQIEDFFKRKVRDIEVFSKTENI